jgi:WS/DGAT/MGAT family acyltransferase
MRQLGGGDAIWFALDTENTPMHIMEVAIYDPSTRTGPPIDLARVKEFVRLRLGGLPLRQKLVTPPWHADFPYWVEDEDFDLDNHIHEIEVQAPGDWDAFRATLEDLMEVPLDRSKPLWEMYLMRGLRGIPGVPDGCFALARKLHHGQFDGTNIIKLLGRLHSTGPESDPPPAEWSRDEWSPEHTPSTTELLLRSPWNRTRRVWKGLQVFGRNLPNLAETLFSRDSADEPEANEETLSKTCFSRSIESRRRVFDGLTFPLEDVKSIRRKVEGATVNDAALAIIAGALRRYLEAHDDLPELPIVVGMPVSAHTEDDPEDAGNRLSGMLINLHIEEADPLERLRLAREATRRAKQSSEQIGAENVADMLDVLPTYLLGPPIEQFVRSGLASHIPMGFSGVALTNAQGPREPLYFDGARMVKTHGCAFLFDGMGLLFAATNYCEDFLIQITSSPEILPDPDLLLRCLRESFEELMAS